jgi:hypothetical protein
MIAGGAALGSAIALFKVLFKVTTAKEVIKLFEVNRRN